MGITEETVIYDIDRKGSTAYLPGEMLAERVCPLAPGDDVLAQIVPNTAIVLLPADADPDYPATLTLADPDSIASQLTDSFEDQLCQTD